MDSPQKLAPSTTPPWSAPLSEILASVGTTVAGLSTDQAIQRRGPAVRRESSTWRTLRLLGAQFASPIVLILLFSATLSIFLRDASDAIIILGIMLASGGLGFWQEYSAASAVDRLLSLVTARARVFRDGHLVEIPTAEVVPGDILELSAGSTLPGDCRLIEAQDLFVNESALTGETFPGEKRPADLPPGTPLNARTNMVFQGTSVISGSARVVVVATGASTEFGRIAGRLRLRTPETEFERGVRRFGYFLMEVTLVLLLGIFAIHLVLRHPALEAFMFALALAVGLTPQLLPAIISVNLAHGARRLARQDVIVRRLSSIENFGSMDILCSDKTGTLTAGTVEVQSVTDFAGVASPRALRLARLNATLETGFSNPIDVALRQVPGDDLSEVRKLDEIPYDFLRKRLSLLVQDGDQRVLITKGSLKNVLEVCTAAESVSGERMPLAQVRSSIESRFQELSAQGLRTLGVACRVVLQDRVTRADEAEMTFVGFIALHDPPKPGIADTLRRLQDMGVRLKMITGDNHLVAANVAGQVGLNTANLLRGEDLRHFSDDALRRRVEDTDVFAEVEPNQKERIILALKRAGHVVGYIGDGINDATALHAADVGISVDQAVDVAKEAADIVLMKPDLNVLCDGIQEGRVTFANTMKYVFMATSANFGNMFSMAGTSLFLPFLPLLPKQILLMNLLTDIPEMTIAQDAVDSEQLQHPRRWNIGEIQRFMLVFGPLSSVFDFLTFGVLLLVLHADQATLRTGWFVESVVSAALVVLVIRSRRPFWRTRPGRGLLIGTVLVALATIALPYLPFADDLGFAPLPALTLAAMLAIVAMYAASAELVKHWFYASLSRRA
ncbi:MAG TPA: magnesium-translocating P-type ATPase [Planctomycetaceae bacterium]|nr:magnesium-translocating P-type ATPase [Planctomycetaceae bacterium]